MLKQMNIRLEEELIKDLKLESINLNTSVQVLTTSYILIGMALLDLIESSKGLDNKTYEEFIKFYNERNNKYGYLIQFLIYNFNQ